MRDLTAESSTMYPDGAVVTEHQQLSTGIIACLARRTNGRLEPLEFDR